MNNSIAGFYLAAVLLLSCSGKVLAQAAAQGDIFQSGANQITTYSVYSDSELHEQAGLRPVPIADAYFELSKGDVFQTGSYDPNPHHTLQDPFDFYCEHPETTFVFYPPIYQPSTWTSYVTGVNTAGVVRKAHRGKHRRGTWPDGDTFESGSIPIFQSGVPRMWGTTNGTIAPSLQGATSGTIGPQMYGVTIGPQLYGVTHGTIGPALQGTTSGPIANVTSTWKYKTREPRWEPYRLPLKIYIGKTVEDARGGLVRATIKSAIADWVHASNGAIRYQFTSKYTEADVVFVEGLTQDHEWGQATVDYHKGPIDRAKVILLSTTLDSLPLPRLKGLCLHECGHIFGVLEHSKNAIDAMSESATDDFHPAVALTAADKQKIARLYERKIWYQDDKDSFTPVPIANLPMSGSNSTK